MLQIAVHGTTYLLARGSTMVELKRDVLDALREAPSFLSLRTTVGRQVEVGITATTGVVIEEHDDTPAALPSIGGASDAVYDDFYGMDFL